MSSDIQAAMDSVANVVAASVGYGRWAAAMSTGSILLAILVTLFGLYEIGYGFYAYHLNGFKFYVSAGFLIGLPLILGGAVLILRSEQPPSVWEGLIFVMWALGVGWKAWRKRMTRRTHPQEWEKWERILNERRR
ncbi:MAG TPA: hypothetical protein VLG46_05065 [Anaerolineae bacterium]|nr:hypothetical protein [Anaerolineae bacterium]